MTHDAILLISFGGPEGPDDVMPFLENVTRGRGIPRERLEAVAHHYYALGGVSPINAQNRELISALRDALASADVHLPIYWGNRNWQPMLAGALQEIAAAGHRRVLGLTTSAYSSYSGCRQYQENLKDALAETGLTDTLSIDLIGQYFELPGFVSPVAEAVVSAVRELPGPVRILFTTHSIPTAMGETSGPPDARGAYVRQHETVAAAVMERVREALGVELTSALVFQSRSGPPQVPWLEPDINDAITSAAAEGVSGVVVVPIGFISDHVEVIWDLDHEAADTAESLGLGFRRAPTVGIDPRFVGDLAAKISVALSSGSGKVCPGDCCPNPRPRP